MIKFSIITISFNAGEAIHKTVDSVIEQNRTDMEYIFVDGASTDHTIDVIRENQSKLEDRGIKTLFISEPDRGISDAFNKGISLARGEIIVILNAADIMMRGALSRVDDEFDKGVDVLYGNILFGNEMVSWVRKSVKEDALKRLKYAMVIQHPATYIRKNAYDQYGLYDISYHYCMDEELLYRFYLLGARFKYVDYLFSYVQAGGVSDEQIRKVLDEGMRIPLAYGDHYIKVRAIAWLKFVKHELAHIYRHLQKRRAN